VSAQRGKRRASPGHPFGRARRSVPEHIDRFNKTHVARAARSTGAAPAPRFSPKAGVGNGLKQKRVARRQVPAAKPRRTSFLQPERERRRRALHRSVGLEERETVLVAEFHRAKRGADERQPVILPEASNSEQTKYTTDKLSLARTCTTRVGVYLGHRRDDPPGIHPGENIRRQCNSPNSSSGLSTRPPQVISRGLLKGCFEF
jgi:hypothetical protein